MGRRSGEHAYLYPARMWIEGTDGEYMAIIEAWKAHQKRTLFHVFRQSTGLNVDAKMVCTGPIKRGSQFCVQLQMMSGRMIHTAESTRVKVIRNRHLVLKAGNVLLGDIILVRDTVSGDLVQDTVECIVFDQFRCAVYEFTKISEHDPDAYDRHGVPVYMRGPSR